MQIFSIFGLGSLIIWLPGLLFFLGVMYTLVSETRGRTAAVYQVISGLFIISILMAIFVPINEINKAVDFANADPFYDGPEITNFADIPFDVQSAYKATALPPEQRPERRPPGGDIFAFDEPAGADGGQPQTAATGGADDIVYNPRTSMAWFLLMFLLIPGVILFVQSLRVFNR